MKVYSIYTFCNNYRLHIIMKYVKMFLINRNVRNRVRKFLKINEKAFSLGERRRIQIAPINAKIVDSRDS